MQFLNVGETFTNKTTQTRYILVKYINCFGQWQSKTIEVNFNQSFHVTSPMNKCYLLN
jgi:hypothetical protein